MINQQISKPDACYCINKNLSTEGKSDQETRTSWVCINAAVEESTISDRATTILKQDTFIRDNINQDDILIVSIGGNDIALKPSMKTMMHLAKLVYYDSDYINSISFKYLVDIFKTHIECYIKALTTRKVPKKIVVCAIYYPCLKGTGWADTTLNLMQYKTRYKDIHKIIRMIYRHATSKIVIPGATIIPCPLYKVLDCNDEQDYIQRVEPSPTGGMKMAEWFCRKLELTPAS